VVPDGCALLADARIDDLHALHHARCGHQGSELMRKMGFAVRPDFHCSSCALANAHKLPTLREKPEESRDPFRLHADTAGPLPLARLGQQYFALFVDEGTGLTLGRFMKTRGEQYDATVSALSEAKATLGRFPSRFRSDNAKEYLSIKLQTALISRSIFRENSAPYHSAANGTAERMVGRVKAIARALLKQAGLSSAWWCEAVSYAIYIINRTPAVDGKSPLEHATGIAPDLSKLRVFGADCYVLIRPQPSGFADRSVRAIFMGMAGGSTSTYQCWDPVGRRMMASRDVVFDERSVLSSIVGPSSSGAPPVLPSSAPATFVPVFAGPSVPVASAPVFAGPPVGASSPVASPLGGESQAIAASPAAGSVSSLPLPQTPSRSESPASVSGSPNSDRVAPSSPEDSSVPVSSLSRLSGASAPAAVLPAPPFPQRRSLVPVPASSLSGLFAPPAVPVVSLPAAPLVPSAPDDGGAGSALSAAVDRVLSDLDPHARQRHGEEEISVDDLVLAEDDRELPPSPSAAWSHPVFRVPLVNPLALRMTGSISEKVRYVERLKGDSGEVGVSRQGLRSSQGALCL
jgi:transposase InsO family protein